MGKKKFEYCYSRQYNKNFSIDDVQLRYETHHQNIGDLRGDMWCPECREAALSFTHQTHRAVAYFSTLEKSSHDKGCSYNYEYIKKDVIKQYMDNLNNKQIADKMESMLNRLLKNTANTLSLQSTYHADNNPLLINTAKTSGVKSYRSIRTKSLNTAIDKDKLGNEIYLFYGTNIKLNLTSKPYRFQDKTTGEIKETMLYILNIYTPSKNGKYQYKANVYLGANYLDINE